MTPKQNKQKALFPSCGMLGVPSRKGRTNLRIWGEMGTKRPIEGLTVGSFLRKVSTSICLVLEAWKLR